MLLLPRHGNRKPKLKRRNSPKGDDTEKQIQWARRAITFAYFSRRNLSSRLPAHASHECKSVDHLPVPLDLALIIAALMASRLRACSTCLGLPTALLILFARKAAIS
jgi:hypothetical protein